MTKKTSQEFVFGWKLKSRYREVMVKITDFCIENHTHRFSREDFPEEIVPLNEWRSCTGSLLCAGAIDTIGEEGKHVLYSAEALLEARREYERRNGSPLSYVGQVKLTEFFDKTSESDISQASEPEAESLADESNIDNCIDNQNDNQPEEAQGGPPTEQEAEPLVEESNIDGHQDEIIGRLTKHKRNALQESDHIKICPDCGLQMTESIKHGGAWFCWGCKVTMKKVKGEWRHVK